MHLAPVPDAYVNHMAEAWHQMAAGKKPTADTVLAAVRGSKATAVSAMQYFWTTYMPAMMTGKASETAPEPILQLAGEIWATAERLAKDQAKDDFASERAALRAATEEVEAERRKYRHTGVEHQAALLELEKRLRDEHRALMDDAAKKRASEIKSSNDDLARERAATAHKQSVIDDLHGVISQLQTDAVAHKDALREVEGKLAVLEQTVAVRDETIKAARDEITALRALADERMAQLQNARADHERAVANLEKEREALLTAQAAAIAAQVEKHEANLDRLITAHEEKVLELKLRLDASETALRKAKGKSNKAAVKRQR